MKRILAFLLCVALFFSFPVVMSSAAETFESQTNYSVALFQIGGTNNKGGQEFVPSQDFVKAIQVYLQNNVSDNIVAVTIYKGSVAQGSTDVVYQENIPIGTGTQWFELTFAEQVTVIPGELYSFSVNTESGAVLFGATGGGNCLGLNYDLAALGGWQRGNITAFKIVSKEEYELVIDLINALPDTVTLSDEAQIVAARAAYEALIATEQSKVTNLAKLEAAEKAISSVNADRDAFIAKITEDIAALSTVTRDSRGDLEQVNQKINEFTYTYGYYQTMLIENLADFDIAIEKYNALADDKAGDVTGNGEVDAKDALEALKFSVGKVELTDKQKFACDVDCNNQYDAKDALMMLQYSVGRRTEFPSDAVTCVPYERDYALYSAKGETLYQNTYQSMIDRIHEDGYADTSITGAYDGMFCRDTSIQIMAHVAQGDYDQARKLLEYVVDYHEENNYDYAIHIIHEDASPSLKKQADTSFFFIHAWMMYAVNATETPEKKAFLEKSYQKISDFANYYLDAGNLDNPYEMLFNESLEHSRDGSYFLSYDLLTNVFASQALHELSEYVKNTDPDHSAKWGAAADKIVGGVHKFLTPEVDGKKIYGELIGRSEQAIQANPNAMIRYIRGFSWVNLAPMACDWYGADPEILENTYQMYMKYGAYTYYNKYMMLDVATEFDTDPSPLTRGNHIIGKGLAWEMLYCNKMGYTDRLAELTAFVEEYSEDMYRETWVYTGGGSDTANQEHASWMLYAHKLIYPELGK